MASREGQLACRALPQLASAASDRTRRTRSRFTRWRSRSRIAYIGAVAAAQRAGSCRQHQRPAWRSLSAQPDRIYPVPGDRAVRHARA
jgi:hypothetical protein